MKIYAVILLIILIFLALSHVLFDFVLHIEITEYVYVKAGIMHAKVSHLLLIILLSFKLLFDGI